MKYLLAGILLCACLTGCTGRTLYDSSSFVFAGIEFVRIPAGTFTMGPSTPEFDSSEHERHFGRTDPRNQVQVTLSEFFLGKTEVTQAQWTSIMGRNPSYYKGDRLPVTDISWEDALAFCGALTEWGHKTGRIPKTMKFTLPTEAQWEYACRAGTTTRFSSGDSEVLLARYAHFSGYAGTPTSTAPVASYLPNPWGLYDMHGNAREMCLDILDRDLPGGKNPCRTEMCDDPREERGFTRRRCRVLRGGTYSSKAKDCTSTRRSHWFFGLGTSIGFRVALVRDSRP